MNDLAFTVKVSFECLFSNLHVYCGITFVLLLLLFSFADFVFREDMKMRNATRAKSKQISKKCVRVIQF